MARQQNRLTALDVQRKTSRGRYPDGGGLYLQIGPTGAKSWLFRYQLNGKSRVLGLGALHAVSLKEARGKAGECRRLIAAGADPFTDRQAKAVEARAEAARNKSFQNYGAEYITANEHAWSNAKHRQQWRNTLAAYAYPIIGALPVLAVDAKAVADVLRQVVVAVGDETRSVPLWVAKPETADRVRGRIEAILDYALADRRQ